jgi:hypothetical protein
MDSSNSFMEVVIAIVQIVVKMDVGFLPSICSNIKQVGVQIKKTHMTQKVAFMLIIQGISEDPPIYSNINLKIVKH